MIIPFITNISQLDERGILLVEMSPNNYTAEYRGKQYDLETDDDGTFSACLPNDKRVIHQLAADIQNNYIKGYFEGWTTGPPGSGWAKKKS